VDSDRHYDTMIMGGDGDGRRPAAVDETTERIAKAMGWFSLGLGVVQIVAPRRLARAIGVEPDQGTETLMRAIGMREIASGLGILGRDRPAGWLSARVAGDAMDMALLGVAMASNAEDRRRVAAAMAAVAGVTVPDVIGAARMSAASETTGEHAGSRHNGGVQRGVRVRAATTVMEPREKVYRFWHDFANFPRFMYHLESVEVQGDGRSHWVAKAIAGRNVEWDAEVTDDRPNELIAWRSLPGSTVPNTGAVRFVDTPGGRGTEIHVEVVYDPPAGPLAVAVAKMFGEEPQQQVRDDLRRLKQVLETGDVVRSDSTLEGAATPALRHQRPARPPEAAVR
jgi:uncharacterized membrane protein